MVTSVERAIRPGQTGRGLVTLANTGNVPTSFAVEVSTGAAQAFGFVSQNTVTVVSPPVAPGRSVTIPVLLPIPADAAAGSRLVRVRIGEAGRAGQLINVLDEQILGGRLRVASVLPPPGTLPLPGEPPPPPPAPAPPAAPQGFRPGQIGLGAIRFTPSSVTPGSAVTVELPVRNLTLTSPTQFPTGSVVVDASIFSLQGVLLRLPEERFTPQMETLRRYSVTIPQTAPAGSYSLLVQVRDGITGAQVLNRTIGGLLQIAAPPPAPGGFTPGSLRLGTVTADPPAVNAGSAVRLALPLTNASDFVGRLRIRVQLISSSGQVFTLPTREYLSGADSTATQSILWIVPDTAVAGAYSARLAVSDLGGRELIATTVPNLFTVRLVMPEIGPIVTDLSVRLAGVPAISPNPALPGQQVSIGVTFANQVNFGGTVIPVIRLVNSESGTVIAVNSPAFFISPRQEVRRDYPFSVPAGAPPGAYELRVVGRDDKGEILFSGIYPAQFTVARAQPPPRSAAPQPSGGPGAPTPTAQPEPINP